jgi:hypothetical protein
MRNSLLISVPCGWCLVLAVVTAGAGQAATAEEQTDLVAVEVTSGRVFRGEIDSQTSETQLWLRWSQGAIVVRRPIHWERVVRAEVGGETLSGEEFRLLSVGQPGQVDAKPVATESGRSRVIRLHSDRSTPPGYSAAAHVAQDPASAAKADIGGQKTPPVRSLAMAARVANWDGDVEVDGLVLEIGPQDASGNVVPVQGTLEVNLLGWRVGTSEFQQPVRLGRWTRLVRPSEFGPAGAAYRFPFQSVHPEFDVQWAPQAAVHARLSVPGEGVFEATESMVRIRPYSAVRDRLQQVSGQRFFGLERTGRGRR